MEVSLTLDLRIHQTELVITIKYYNAIYIYIYISVYLYIYIALSTGAVEYTDCISAEG